MRPNSNSPPERIDAQAGRYTRTSCTARAARHPCTTALALAAALFVSSAAARAKLVEEVVQLPVRVKDRFGSTHERAITLTILRDDTRERAPFLVLNHGRPGSASARERFGRPRSVANSTYFV